MRRHASCLLPSPGNLAVGSQQTTESCQLTAERPFWKAKAGIAAKGVANPQCPYNQPLPTSSAGKSSAGRCASPGPPIVDFVHEAEPFVVILSYDHLLRHLVATGAKVQMIDAAG